MLLSRITLDGITITTNSTIELVQFLLQKGMPKVYTESFCQDPLEEFFGSERQLGRQNDNPDLYMFGHNTNTIRVKGYISCTTGNTSGRKDKKNVWTTVSDDPVPKRKKQHLPL